MEAHIPIIAQIFSKYQLSGFYINCFKKILISSILEDIKSPFIRKSMLKRPNLAPISVNAHSYSRLLEADNRIA